MCFGLKSKMLENLLISIVNEAAWLEGTGFFTFSYYLSIRNSHCPGILFNFNVPYLKYLSDKCSIYSTYRGGTADGAKIEKCTCSCACSSSDFCPLWKFLIRIESTQI